MTKPNKTVGLLALMTEMDDPEVRDIVEMRGVAEIIARLKSGSATELALEAMRQNVHKEDGNKL